MRCDPSHPGRVELSEFGRQAGGEHHANGHPLAMKQCAAEPGFGRQRVAEMMTEIEQRACPGLALVSCDDCSLHPAALLNRGAEDCGIKGENTLSLLFEMGEEIGVAREGGLDHL